MNQLYNLQKLLINVQLNESLYKFFNQNTSYVGVGKVVPLFDQNFTPSVNLSLSNLTYNSSLNFLTTSEHSFKVLNSGFFVNNITFLDKSCYFNVEYNLSRYNMLTNSLKGYIIDNSLHLNAGFKQYKWLIKNFFVNKNVSQINNKIVFSQNYTNSTDTSVNKAFYNI
jgi:hypothetical protein